MKKTILLIVLVLGLLVGSSRVFADPIVNPTHFDDTYWYWPSAPAGFSEMDTNMTPEIDGSPDGYYFASNFWFAGDYPATGGYLGLQTEGAEPTGKIAIFSIWGSTAASGPGTNLQFNEDGTGYSSRIPYQWVVNNTYDLRVALTSTSAQSNIWTASVIDTNTGAASLIGSLTVPASRGQLYDVSGTFHERYSGPTASCSDMQESQVTFTDLTADNGSVSPSSHDNVSPTGSACAGYFATEDIAGGIRTVIGGQFPPPPTPTITVPKPTTVVPQPTVVGPSVAANPTKIQPIVSNAKPAPTATSIKPVPTKRSSVARTTAYTVAIGLPSLLLLGCLGLILWRLFGKRVPDSLSVHSAHQRLRALGKLGSKHLFHTTTHSTEHLPKA